MDIKGEIREKEKNYSTKGAIATMALCIVIDVVFLLGWLLKFTVVPVPTSILIVTTIGFVLSLTILLLCTKGIFSRVMPYLISIIATLIITYALSYIDPQIKVVFFLIYFYIVLHPAILLGMKDGLFAITIIDLSYAIMVFTIQSYHPEMNIGIEFLKLIVFTFISFLIVSDLDKNLKRIQIIRRLLSQVEQGDLTIRAHDSEKDEISYLGESLNRLLQTEFNIVKMIVEIMKRMVEIGGQIASTAGGIASSISEIVQTTQKMTMGINEQFDELDKTISTGKALSETSFEVVNNVKKIEGFSLNVSHTASSAINQSDIVTSNIELISNRYEDLTVLMKKLQETSTTINKIVETINALSEKINILSLNASIEAARAGEYGRGFSIVADEIKKLADNTQLSATEIGNIIREMIDSIRTVTERTEEVKQALFNGSVVVKSTTDSLNNISTGVIELNKAIKNIKDMISQEEKEITNIINKVERSYDVSKENAAAAEEILSSIQEQSAATEEFSATSQELIALSNKLQEIIQRFKL